MFDINVNILISVKDFANISGGCGISIRQGWSKRYHSIGLHTLRLRFHCIWGAQSKAYHFMIKSSSVYSSTFLRTLGKLFQHNSIVFYKRPQIPICELAEVFLAFTILYLWFASHLFWSKQTIQKQSQEEIWTWNLINRVPVCIILQPPNSMLNR